MVIGRNALKLFFKASLTIVTVSDLSTYLVLLCKTHCTVFLFIHVFHPFSVLSRLRLSVTNFMSAFVVRVLPHPWVPCTVYSNKKLKLSLLLSGSSGVQEILPGQCWQKDL